MLNRYNSILSLLLLCLFHTASTQSIGVPYIHNYAPEDYGADGQNWATVQDQNGLMYFGNTDGVLEFDGIGWRLIETERKTVIRSLAVDNGNTIFVGAYGEIGYLEPDSLAGLTYVSLLPYVDSIYHDFADVWITSTTSNAVYFQTQKYIFRWKKNKMTVWETPSFYLHLATVNDDVYVRQWTSGLMKMVDDSLIVVPGGERFDLPIMAGILPFANGSSDTLLICTQTDGLFLYDGHQAIPFETNFDKMLSDARVYQGLKMSNGHYALATILDGIFVMDHQGQLLRHINKSSGLQNNAVWCMYEDSQTGLWLTLDDGISRVEINSPLTYLNHRQGVEGKVLDIVQHKGRLYTATSTGLYVLDESKGMAGVLTPINGIPPQCFDLLDFGAFLLVATFQGIFEVRGSQVREVNPSYVFSLGRSSSDSNRVFVGMQKGLKSLYFDKGKWIEEGLIGDFDLEVRDLFETIDGTLWATTRHQGILRITYTDGFQSDPSIKQYDTKDGLPAGDKVTAIQTAVGIRFITPEGVYRFNSASDKFEADSMLIPNLPNQNTPLLSASEDQTGSLWINPMPDSKPGVARKMDTSYHWDDTPLLQAKTHDIQSIYPDAHDQGIIWFGANERIIRYDDGQEKFTQPEFKTLIRSVTINGDSVISYGHETPAKGSHSTLPNLSYSQNALRLTFAALSFDEGHENKYQYQLVGYDDDWSGWSSESWKDYTNLREGHYRFKVRAKNVYREVSDPAIVAFIVKPPFYRTWWAYTFFALILFSLLYALRHREMNRIHRKHQIEMEQLEFQKLKELDQLKSKFFTNISHEFRTPLSLILGPTEKLLARYPDGRDGNDFRMIKRNAQRLLTMINQILNLSRLEADKTQLVVVNEDILPLVNGITSSFEFLAESKEIALTFESSIDRAGLSFDRNKIEQVMTNLIANAIKFTPRGGAVSVFVRSTEDQQRLEIVVQDTGSGISEDELAHIFDRFYRAKDVPDSQTPGSGIGLALCKELTELHGGQIRVVSQLGHGSQFIVSLPFVDEQPQITNLPRTTPEFEHTVLLVEDNPDMRAFVRSALDEKFQVIEAEDGQQGLALAIEHIPDLIVSDVMMPKMDGLELCTAVKQDDRTSHVPFILLSAKSGLSARLKGLKRGADDYLGKPFHHEELLLRVHNLIDWRKSLQKRFADPQPSDDVSDLSVHIEVEFLKKVRDIFLDQINNPEMDIERLAQSVGMSRSQLFRKLKSLTGLSPSRYIRNIRLSVGKNLLESSTMNVAEVAYQVGFSTPNYFSDAFNELYGIRPSQIRK